MHHHGAILSDTAIRAAIERGQIHVSPMRPGAIGSNSIDLHLGRHLLAYDTPVVDPKVVPRMREVVIPEDGLLLEAGKLFLGVTEEYTECRDLVPWLDGRSSVGRMGLFCHITAGRGDTAFRGHWTLEISACAPPVSLRQRLQNTRVPWHRRLFHPGGVVVYPGMPIAQLTYFQVDGVTTTPYPEKASAKYMGEASKDPRPQPTQIWRSFSGGGGHARPG